MQRNHGHLLFRLIGRDGEITMVIVGIKDGVVQLCVSVDDVSTLQEMYPDHQFIEQVGSETIGWTYDGATFTAPLG